MDIFIGTSTDANTDAVLYVTDSSGETHTCPVHSATPFTALGLAVAAREAARLFSGDFPRIHPVHTPGRVTLASAAYLG